MGEQRDKISTPSYQVALFTEENSQGQVEYESLGKIPSMPKDLQWATQGAHLYNSKEALQLQKDHHAWNKYLDVILNIFYIVVWKVHGLTLF